MSGAKDNRPSTRRRHSSSSFETTAATARTFVRRTSSRVWEERPKSPAGWTILASSLCAAALGYELRLQKQLTQAPLVFLQRSGEGDTVNLDNSVLQQIYERLTATKNDILAQPIQPSLWVGTRAYLASSCPW